MFECVKVNKRLWIKNTITGQLIYTHPNFIQLHGRDLMKELAARATEAGELKITDIMVFESRAPRGYGARKRTQMLEWDSYDEPNR